MSLLCCDVPGALNRPSAGCPANQVRAPWTCVYPIYGCPDSTADNFHFLFRLKPDLIEEPQTYNASAVAASLNPYALAYASLVPDRSICQYGGCTDQAADNFSPNATYNDGTCSYPYARPHASAFALA